MLLHYLISALLLPAICSFSNLPPSTSSSRSSFASSRTSFALQSKLLPVLPLDLQEVLLPGQTRHLHLYEARFLSLLTKAQTDCDNEVLLGLLHGGGMLKLAVLAKLESTTREEVGVGVDLRAVKVCNLVGVESEDDVPFLQARFEGGGVSTGIGQLDQADEVLAAWGSVRELLSKADLKTDEIRVDPRSFDRYEVPSGQEDDDEDLMLRARTAAGACTGSVSPDEESVREYLSWLCFEGSGISDKLKALEASNTDQRLAAGLELLRERERVLAAKVAIKSAFD